MSDQAGLVTQLSAWLAETDIDLLELIGPDGTLRLVREGAHVGPEIVDPATGDADGIVAAPTVGLFLDRHPLRLEPCAWPGSRHAAGEPLGFLRIGPVLVPVAAPAACVVHATLVPDGTVVGYGTPLLSITALVREEAP
jgi:acetyl-CoA carboxylase biotin carboxyl carrier protein